MKKARIILTALVLLAGVGGALAFKASRFTANPVHVSTDHLTLRIGTLTYTAFAGISGAPVILCTLEGLLYWTPVGGFNGINAFSTLAATTSIPFTATTAGGIVTVTKIVNTCVPTVGCATFAI